MATETIFFNQVFDKKRLKVLIGWVLKEFGEKQALRVVEELKKIGFSNATQAGLSIGLNDLSTPIQKISLISKAEYTMSICDQDFNAGRITATERSQRIVDTWHRVSETLRKQVVDHFSTYDQLNPVYIMALSGARGNFSQVRQLVGMRGLMADPQGQIISFPIRSNLREGLTLTEYFISCSGARKGLVDTALRTADTGYLTRRLVDVAHHIVIKKVNCNTDKGLLVRALKSENKLLLSLCDRLVGRVLAQDIEYLVNNTKNAKLDNKSLEINKKHLLAQKNQEICPTLASEIQKVKDQVFIRSPLTCALPHSVCQLCYGWSLSQGKLVSLGDAVGVIAAQSIGEPGTQLTMRTFHTGGVFSGDLLHEIRAPHSGRIEFSKAFQGLMIRTTDGQIAFLTKTPGEIILENNKITEQTVFTGLNKALSGKKGTTKNGEMMDTQAYTTWWSHNTIWPPFYVAKDENVGAMLYQRDALIASVPKVLSLKKLTIIRGLIARYMFDKKYMAFLPDTPHEVCANKNLPIKLAINMGGIQRKNILVGKVDAITGFYKQDQITLLNKIIRSCLLYASNQMIQTNSGSIDARKQVNKQTRLQFQALSLLFVRQSEYVRKNQLLAQISLFGEEGNQPIKTRQTIFAELSGKVFETQGAVNSETDISQYENVDALKAHAYDSIQPEKSAKLGIFHILATQIGATFDFNSFPLAFYEPTSIQKIPNLDLLNQPKLSVNNKVVRDLLAAESRDIKRNVDKGGLRFAFGRVQSLKQNRVLTRYGVSGIYEHSKKQTRPERDWIESSKLALPELQGETISTLTTKSLQLKCAHNPYTAQFFSSTQNKNVVASLVKKRLYKVKKLKSLAQTTLYPRLIGTRRERDPRYPPLTPTSGGSERDPHEMAGNSGIPQSFINKPYGSSIPDTQYQVRTRECKNTDDLYLRTIAQEGDLVDSSYKNCFSSSFLSL